jgi:tetratricopeptide (TPR) repeat protein
VREDTHAALRVLADLLVHGTHLEPRHVWRVLTVEEREAALRKVVVDRSPDPDVRAHWHKFLVKLTLDTSTGFRPSTIRSWTTEQLVSHVARLTTSAITALVEPVVLEHHSPELLELVQAPLLDRLRITHVSGVVEGDALEGLAAHSDDSICTAALDAWRAARTRDMALYLMALAVVIPRKWGVLRAILPTVGEELMLADDAGVAPSLVVDDAEAAGVEADDAQDAAGVDDLDDGDVGNEETDEAGDTSLTPPPSRVRAMQSETALLSPLDEELILRIAASLQDVVGSPSEERVDTIIDELIRLNATRHQTFYLRGFHDAVRRRADRTVLPAQNPSRWRWYMAGYVSGLARLQDQESIVALWERRPEARTLGDTGQGPSQYGVLHVVRALQARERFADAVAFCSPEAVARNRALAEIVLDIGTGLQRQQRLSDASPVFERLLLTEAITNRMAPNFWATVKRRHAHCLRSEGKLEAAQRLLEEALEEAEAGERAMITVDLGLIKAGFGRLADLRLPSSFESATATACLLDRGDDRFREAEALGVSTSSHAHYVLGMRELLRRRYPEAEQLLSLAVSQFDLERERYEPAQLLRRAHLHAAIARCANTESDASRLDQAMRDISAGIDDPQDVPDIFVEEVITGLLLREDVHADALVEHLLTAKRDPLLDGLCRDRRARHSAAVADALGKRLRRAHRTERQRMVDGIALVEMLLLQGRQDECNRVLDEIEEMAVLTAEGDLFLQFLERAGDQLTSVWESVQVADARVRVLESMGRYDEAAQELRRAFARARARDDAQGRLDAEDILDVLAGYGCASEQELTGMRSRLLRAAPVMRAPPTLHRPIHILVVGGNEVQAQYDEAIIAHYRSTAAWVTVEFMHTGWSSNWGEKVEEFKRRVVRADGVVLIYLMRTEFGRSIRKHMNNRPWRGCGGKGRDSIQRAIDQAVDAVHASISLSNTAAQ